MSEKMDLDVKIAKFTAAIKSSRSAHLDIRKALEPNISTLIQAPNELLVEAVTRLKAEGYRDLVLIVDSLDRLASSCSSIAEPSLPRFGATSSTPY